MPVSLPLGELFSLTLPGQSEQTSSEVLACVIRCDPVSASSWEVGCTFASPLSTQDLRRFEVPAAEAPAVDRRGWDRFPCAARASYQIVRAVGEAECLPAAVLNISLGGVALKPAHPVDMGDLLSVDLYHGNDYVATSLASVVRATRDPEGLVVGCNFIRELPEHHLARLLG
jgi:hypothetical protein